MNFRQKVYKWVKEIPAGSVATYGQIAALAGSPRAARQVGFALHSLGIDEADIPWWRVVNSKGYLSINHGHDGAEKELQKDNLVVEGVKVADDMTIDLTRYLWDAQDH
jgi:methylated-DNA-protein-cysteine methyltransferase-like protein